MSEERKSFECDWCANPTDNIEHTCCECGEEFGAAKVAVRKMSDQLFSENSDLKARIKELKEKLSLYEWRDIKDAPKDKIIFIFYKNSLGKGRTVKALYAGKFEIVDNFSEGEFSEYDEATDRYYWPEGWYEDVEADTGCDYSYHHLGDVNPTHFMNIPTPPSTQEEA